MNNEIDYDGIILSVEYTITKSSFKPYKNYYHITEVTLVDSYIDLSYLLSEETYISIKSILREINERVS